MKILFYCDEYPPYPHGGIGSVVKIVSEALVKKNHEVFVVGSYVYGHNLPHEQIINGVNVLRETHFRFLKYIPKIGRSSLQKVLNRIGLLHFLAEKNIHLLEGKIQKLIFNNGIDLLELSDYVSLHGFLMRDVSFREFSIKTVMRVHGGRYFLTQLNGELNRFWFNNDFNHFKRVDRVIATSVFSKEFVEENFGIEKSDCSVVYNPIEESFLNSSKKVGLKKTIVFIGKIVKTKGAFSLLEVFNEIASKYKDLNLVMIGGGDLKKGKNIVSKQYLDRVHFTGYIERDDIKSFIDNSRFCIIPSHFENFSLVALEIMGRSKALIYTNRTSGPELVRHLENGLLVNPFKNQDIYDKMVYLIEHYDLAENLGLNAFKDVSEKYTVNRIIDELEKEYLELIDN